MKKFHLGLIVTSLTLIGLASSCQKAEASTCPPTHPPDNYYQCNGQQVTGSQIDYCEPPSQQQVSSGGCYDEDGDCVKTGYAKVESHGFCWIKVGPAFTAQEDCYSIEYGEMGDTCYDI